MFFSCANLFGLDYVTYADPQSGQVRNLEGRIVTNFANGIAMELTTGELIFCRKENIREQNSDNKEFAPLSQAEMVKVVREEFPDFKVIASDNFIIAYQTSDAFADWYRTILENLNRSFTTFWKNRGVVMKPPEFPLVVVLYTSRPAFQRHAVDFYGSQESIKNIAGFYHIRKNYIFLYDSSRIHSTAAGTGNVRVTGAATESRATPAQIEEFLKRPGITQSVDLLVHEGAHQLAYNTGLQVRWSGCPSWFTEGIAIIRGTPKRTARNGWEIDLRIDDQRYPDLRRYLRTKPNAPILTVVRDDVATHVKETQSQSYGMAWGLTFYLMTKHPKEFVEYVGTLNKAAPFTSKTADIRQKEFEQHFGNDWKTLEEDFAREMMRLW